MKIEEGRKAFIEYCSVTKNYNQQSIQQGNIKLELLKYLCGMKRLLQNSDRSQLMGQDHFNK